MSLTQTFYDPDQWSKEKGRPGFHQDALWGLPRGGGVV